MVGDTLKDASQDFPTFQPGQSCATCLQLKGAAGDA